MLKFLPVLSFFFLSLSCSTPTESKSKITLADTIIKKDTVPTDSVADLNSLNNNVRDGKVSKADALVQLKLILPLINAYYFAQGGKVFTKKDWMFPLQRYNASNIGGTNGSGYVDDGYNYFDGNKHKGHPAHDIFINDSDQDCIDDRTKLPVNVISMTGGIVVAIETKWVPTSDQRGGNYIWIYDPNEDSFFYYAHNSQVLVKPGTIVKPGDVIAHVGRTGLNAFKKRSPTHLHLMQLTFDKNFIPLPVNPYKDLVKAN